MFVAISTRYLFGLVVLTNEFPDKKPLNESHEIYFVLTPADIAGSKNYRETQI